MSSPIPAPISPRSSRAWPRPRHRAFDLPRKAVVIPHEHAAMGMAHGYYLMSGRAQAVMLHTNVGLANGAIGAINAACEHVPDDPDVGPHAGDRGRPLRRAHRADRLGAGDARPGALVREACQMGLRTALPRTGRRTSWTAPMAIANSTPKGPVYLSLPREVLCETRPVSEVGAPIRHAPRPSGRRTPPRSARRRTGWPRQRRR